MAGNEPAQMSPQSNIYTTLAIIGTVFLIIGTVVVGYRSQVLFDSWMPFSF